MFNKRSDGKYITLSDPFFRVIPHIMPTRSESQVLYQHEFDVCPLAEYIREKRQNENIDISYLSLFIACYVRTIHENPQLNRFIINRRIYARNDISIVFIIKKRLDLISDESAIKISFNGDENIVEIQNKIQQEIGTTLQTTNNDSEALAKFFNKLPNFLIRIGVGCCKFADNHNFLPKSLISASPFHTSMYITYLKSIKLDRVYHHLYNFGTCSIFAGIGKTTQKCFDGKRTISIGYTVDERICDGFSMSKAFKTVEKILKNPKLLD